MKIVKSHGGPDDLIQTVRNGSIETTQELMKVVDVVVATGGGAMVKSRLLVGQAVVRRRRRQRAGDHRPRRGHQGRRRQDRHRRLVRQRHHLLARAVRPHARRAVRRDREVVRGHRQGVVHGRRDQVQKLRDVVFPGRPPEQGRRRPVGARDRRDGGHRCAGDARASSCCPAKGAGMDDVLAKEKLCPVVAILPYTTFQEAVEKAQGEPARRRRGPLGGAALQQREPTSAAPAPSCR